MADNLNVPQASILTALLVASSFTLMSSKRNLLKGKLRNSKIWMGFTLGLGLIFISGQIKEYIDLYHKQVTLSRDIFGSSFFTLTGFHGMHVILGLIAISLLFAFSFGKMKIVTLAGISGVEVYWHFVDIVWLFVFFFVYITPLL